MDHPRLFVETKLRASSATRRLWEQTRDLARREGKAPVLALYAKSKPGALLVIHQDDMDAVAAEWLAARDEREANDEKPA